MTRYGKCGYDDKNVVINNYLLLFQTVWQFVAESIVVRDKKNLSIKILKGFLDPKLNMETETITRDFDFRQVWVMKADLKINTCCPNEFLPTNWHISISSLFPFPRFLLLRRSPRNWRWTPSCSSSIRKEAPGICTSIENPGTI